MYIVTLPVGAYPDRIRQRMPGDRMMTAEHVLRVLLVDDHAVVRRGLRAVLTQPRIEVVGEAGTVQAGIEEARRLAPDVVVLDLRLPDGSGIEACREIRAILPDTKVLILTSYADED